MAQSLTEEQIAAVTDAIFAGQKIQAIKLYREAANTELVEAKQFVEKLEAELRVQYPDRFSASFQFQTKTSLVFVAMLLAIGIAVAAMLFLARVSH